MSSDGSLLNLSTCTPTPSLSTQDDPNHHQHQQTGFNGGGQSIGPPPAQHLVNHQVDPTQRIPSQGNMLDIKMSTAVTSPSSSSSPSCNSAPSLSPVTPANILSECYIGMWESDMSHPPPTKLETTDIMDLIEPGCMARGVPSPSRSPSSPHPNSVEVPVEPGSTSPTTIIHHTPSLSLTVVSSCSSPSVSSTSRSSSSSTSTSVSSVSSSSSSSTSQYLMPLPSLGDPYNSSAEGVGGCHGLLDGYHTGMDVTFHKLSDTSHVFQEGGYDAFISEMSQPAPTGLSQHEHHHHNHSHQHQLPPHHHSQHHHQVPSLHNDNGVLLLDMSNDPPPPSSHHHHHHPPQHSHHHHHLQSNGQCSPGCSYLSTSSSSYSSASSLVGGGDPFGGALGTHPHPHHQHHLHEIHRHHPDYSTSWDDLHNAGQHNPADLTGEYSILFRKGESPTTSDSVVSYTDNDSESKSSSSVGLSEISHHHHISPPPAKRKVGRPPKKDKKLKRNEKKTGRLWEFIRDLLKNPEYCPSLVKWENHEEGHFRFVNSEKVAQLWGQIKGNPRMTYEKLSRAMRYYYKSHVFEPVLGRRLVYKFGYNATNWKPINPNFASSSSSSTSVVSSSPSPHGHLHHANNHHHHHQYHQKMYN